MALGLKCGGTLQERAERYKYHHIYIKKNKFYLLDSVYLLYLKVVPDFLSDLTNRNLIAQTNRSSYYNFFMYRYWYLL